MAEALIMSEKTRLETPRAYWMNRSPQSLKPHPVSLAIYGDEPVDGPFLQSVRESGVLVPLAIKANGTIISGHRRLKAALACDLDVVPVTIVEFPDELAERQAIIDHNRQREKTLTQRMHESEALEEIERERANTRMLAGKALDPTATLPEGSKGETREKVAEAIGMKPRTYDKAKKIYDAAQEGNETAQTALKEIDAGETSINAVYTEIKRQESESKREARREENRKMVQETQDPLKVGAKFATIVIDPPWDWGDEGDVDQFGRAKPTYATMPLAEIEKLPVGELADVDCHLYLWISNRSLPKGFGLIDAWGFRYVTCLTWCKPSIGMGNYFRGSTEHILFAIKGSQPLNRKDVGTWFQAPRGSEHSAKPDAFFRLVESCSPGPYLEMFARNSRPGWISWGAQV